MVFVRVANTGVSGDIASKQFPFWNTEEGARCFVAALMETEGGYTPGVLCKSA
jgi:hypothetical protein